MADGGVEAFPGEANGWAALEAAHRAALTERGEVPPTPEQVFAVADVASEDDRATETPKAASAPAPRRKRGLDADARKRLGHKP